MSATTVTPMEAQLELEDSEPGELTALLCRTPCRFKLTLSVAHAFHAGAQGTEAGSNVFYTVSLYKLARAGI